jgi:hypothetical protein
MCRLVAFKTSGSSSPPKSAPAGPFWVGAKPISVNEPALPSVRSIGSKMALHGRDN